MGRALEKVQEVATAIGESAVDLIESVRADGHCEFMTAIAEPLPVQMFMKIFGLPLERQTEYRAIVKEVLSSPGVEPKERVRRVRASRR